MSSSPLVSGPLNAEGDRALFFVAMSTDPQARNGGQKLFKLTIARAHLREAAIAAVTDTGNIGAHDAASPTLTYLAANSTAVEPHVAVGTTRGRVYTFSVALLAPGPKGAVGAWNSRAMTPSVPVTPAGLPPGADGSGVAAAPHLFVATTDGQTTIVHRLTRNTKLGYTLRFDVVDSAELPGGAAGALATSQLSTPDGPTPGLLYVTTSKNLYALDTADLGVRAQLSPTELPPGQGFGQTAPSVAGGLVFASRDDGAQLVLDGQSLQPVAELRFRQHPDNNGSRVSFGQPAIANGQAAFVSDRGLFVYRLEGAAG